MDDIPLLLSPQGGAEQRNHMMSRRAILGGLGSWTSNRPHYSLPRSGYSARLLSKVCVNKPSAPDACSPDAIYTQNY